MATTRTVTGTVKLPNGEPWEDASVEFRLVRHSATPETIFPAETVAATTDENGDFSIDLWTTSEGLVQTSYSMKLPNGQVYLFTLPAGAGSILIGDAIAGSAFVAPEEEATIQTLVSSAVTTHVAETDPHTSYLLKGLAPNARHRAGWWTTAASFFTGVDVQTPALGTLYLYPLVLQTNVQLDRVAVEVTSPTLEAAVLAGIWEDDGTFYPGALKEDWGEFSAVELGLVAKTIGTTLEAGTYWVGVLCPADGTSAELRAATGSLALLPFSDGADVSEVVGGAYTISGLTELPTNPVAEGLSSTAPRITVRAASVG